MAWKVNKHSLQNFGSVYCSSTFRQSNDSDNNNDQNVLTTYWTIKSPDFQVFLGGEQQSDLANTNFG